MLASCFAVGFLAKSFGFPAERIEQDCRIFPLLSIDRNRLLMKMGIPTPSADFIDRVESSMSVASIPAWLSFSILDCLDD